MKVILMRHGQTDENVAHRHQPNQTPLSTTGRQQVYEAAAKLNVLGTQFPLTHIIVSPHNRALETASILAEYFDLIPSIGHPFAELQRPRALTGYHHFSLQSLLFYKFWFFGLSFTVGRKEVDSGETYRQFRDRLIAARTHLETLPPEAVVVVVSHTVFINLFLAHLHRQRALNSWQVVCTFWKMIKLPNAALIELTFDEAGWHRTNDLHLMPTVAR